MTGKERVRPRPLTEFMDGTMVDDPQSQYTTACCSLMGLHHADQGIPCQDNSGCYSGSDYSIVVVSDGHSDHHCFRSDIGSTIAVATTLESLRSKFDDGGLRSFLDDAQCDSEGQMDVLWKEILIAWKMRVKEYDNLHPVTEDERDGLRRRISGKVKGPEETESVLEQVLSQPVFRFYGCTLRVAVQYPEGYMLLSLGDGETVVVRHDGTTECPIPDDEDTTGSETHSMCDDNPFGHCRYVLSDEPVAGIAVCSDGIHCADEGVDNRYYLGEFIKRTFRSMSEQGWESAFEDAVNSFTLEFPKDDCSVAFTVSKEIDPSGLDIAVRPLVWDDEPMSFTVSERSFKGRREFGFMFNVFDEMCYRGLEGMEVMHPLMMEFCEGIPDEVRASNDREDAFISGVRLMLQKWNRAVMEHDKDNPDTPEQDLLRLTNGIVVQNRSQKYGLSIALSVVIDDLVYSALVGNGSMAITTSDGDRILEYEQPESIAHVNFRNIQCSVDDASCVMATGMDGSGTGQVLINRRPGLLRRILDDL